MAGDKAARTPRFVKTRNGELDEASLQRARHLVGLKGYVTNIEAARMPATEVIASYQTCGESSSPSGCRNPTSPPDRCSLAPAMPSKPT
ncbi:hypothetical protein Mkiyose1665_04880 [Mycobacterium kiyosense]|uniref:Uncharacterized protein n=1 Tax=Mycobacterium kiyosense TaxID=2871094 RepID=A0A9P3Q1W2_9MYCO|nr:hypothetical protein IWGMT90018_31570 [Mycobacterium kiyosense]BDE14037.1 hypothetical protein MKCMC460_28970 [Mycobacterium sp. 20KCMC460]GLB81207.1 hypothetical protein SRL2020028_04630 [Mycobacterium kiyosense]GLB88237.1 hypothetical protein SRL2020130_10540 [Mycobacterium kiyosense]GLB94543.1 hypothetical protein SRL2020226_13190 [Mycobacterium kiyosense]